MTNVGVNLVRGFKDTLKTTLSTFFKHATSKMGSTNATSNCLSLILFGRKIRRVFTGFTGLGIRDLMSS